MDSDRVMQLIGELNRHQVEDVVVGGVALNFQGLVGATEDIDLFVRPTEDNVARLRLALTAVWPDPEVRERSTHPISPTTIQRFATGRRTKASSSTSSDAWAMPFPSTTSSEKTDAR